MNSCLRLAAALCGLSLPVFAIPSSISIQGEGPLGDLVGTMTYDSSDFGSGVLTFDLTNTSSPDNGGYLTAFLFNMPQGASFSDFEFSSSVPSADFHAIWDDGTRKSPAKAGSYGTFDLGAASTKTFLGGGSPRSGLPVGGSGLFMFSLQGSGLDSLSVDSFINAGTSLASFDDEAFLVARFRGFDNGGGNKTPVYGLPDSSTTLLLFGISLAGLMLLAQRAGGMSSAAPRSR